MAVQDEIHSVVEDSSDDKIMGLRIGEERTGTDRDNGLWDHQRRSLVATTKGRLMVPGSNDHAI